MRAGLTDNRAGSTSAAAATAPEAPPAPVAIAVVLAATPGASGEAAALAPLLDDTIVSRLVRQLRDLGNPSIVVVTRPAWRAAVRATVGPVGGVAVEVAESPAADLRLVARIAASAPGTVLLAQGDIVAHQAALAGLATEPRVTSGILAGAPGRFLAQRVQTRRGRVIGASSAYHSLLRANGSFLGVLKVGADQLGALADAASRLAGLVDDLPPAWSEEFARKTRRWHVELPDSGSSDDASGTDDFFDPGELDDARNDWADEPADQPTLSEEERRRAATRVAAAREDVVPLLLVGLVRGGATIGTVYLRRLMWTRPLLPGAPERAAERIRAADEDARLLDSAVKGNDGFFTTFFVSPYSKHIARWAAHRGLTPNQVTIASMAIGALAAAAFATGERWGLVAGAVLLQLAFTTDCVDGQLARYTRTFSRFGAWLDSVFDRAKEYLAFAGLAIGASRTGDPVWLLACLALALQTIRHMGDFAYMSARAARLVAIEQAPLEQPADAATARFRQRRATGAPPPPPRRRPLARRIVSSWYRVDSVGGARWVKRAIAFPIGERFAAISLTAALFDARVTFIVLLAWGGIAFVYGTTGRVLRAMR